jgi:hypothetical protein
MGPIGLKDRDCLTGEGRRESAESRGDLSPLLMQGAARGSGGPESERAGS